MPDQVRAEHVVNFLLAGDNRTQGEIDWLETGKSVHDCNDQNDNKKNVREDVRQGLGPDTLCLSLIQGYVLMRLKRD